MRNKISIVNPTRFILEQVKQSQYWANRGEFKTAISILKRAKNNVKRHNLNNEYVLKIDELIKKLSENV